MPISHRINPATGACSAWAAGGFRAAFSLAATQHWTQHTHPSSSHTQLWITTCWRQLLVAARLGLGAPSTWNKRCFQCLVGLASCLTSPSRPFKTGNPSCSLPTDFFGYSHECTRADPMQDPRSRCLFSSPLWELSAMPGSVSAVPWAVLLAGQALSSCRQLCPHLLHTANPRTGKLFFLHPFPSAYYYMLFQTFHIYFQEV